ncbi:MAG: BspA family leucine-rich repeat surface protein [Bacilli bacterium]|nr:BspA family leucine-rich repeat surface protein [Bacilli bacterium]
MDGYISNENLIKNKYKKKFIIPMFFVFAVLVIVGVSYALWQLTFTQTGTNVITTGCLKLILSDDTDAINLTDATPISDEDGKKLVPYTFTLENMCTTETAYVINLETLSNGDKILADNYIRATLTDENNELFFDNLLETHVNEEKVIEEASIAYKLYQGKLGNKENVSFNLRLWMDEETPAIDEVMSATWQGKITVTATYIPPVSSSSELPIIQALSADGTYEGEFWNPVYSQKIADIIIEDTIHEVDNVIESWNVAEDKTDPSKRVMAHLVRKMDSYLGQIETPTQYYVLYLQGEGGIKANKNSTHLFSGFIMLENIIGLEYFDTSDVVNMSNMFAGCQHLERLSLDTFNTSKVTDMFNMFYACTSLTSLDLKMFDTSQVEIMNFMFRDCINLVTLDLTNFDFANNVDGMFYDCGKLNTSFIVSSSRITNYTSMFENAATEDGAQIVVNFLPQTETLADFLISTKSINSNVIKGDVLL